MTIFRPKFFFALALTLALSGYRKPKNPRWGKKGKPAADAVAKSSSTAETPPKPAGPPPASLGARWTDEVRAALVKLVAERGQDSPSYNPRKPPVAVIGHDAAALAGDPAEIVFFKLVREAEFKFSEDFWAAIPIGAGRQRARAVYEQFSPLPRGIWDSQPAYKQWRKAMLAGYQNMCEKVGRKECRSHLARLMIGFTEEQALEYARKALAEELERPAGVELVGEYEGDQEAVRWRRGLVAHPEMKALVGTLRGAGFDVWAVGMEAQPILLAAAELSGIDATRCLGIRQGFERDRLNGQLRVPIPYRGGAVEAVVAKLGRPPALVVTASEQTQDLVRYAEGLKVFVDRGDEKLRALMVLSGALVQPAFR